MSQVPNDPDLKDAVQKALDNFDEVGEESDARIRMSYEEQCVRGLVSGLGTSSSAAKDIVRAAKDAKAWSFGLVHDCFPHLPAVLVAVPDSLKQKPSVLAALKTGTRSKLVKLYYQARSTFEVRPQSTACFMRTPDWGNIVVHGLVWAGDDTLRASIPRVLLPSLDDPGDVLVVEARKTFVKFLGRVALAE